MHHVVGLLALAVPPLFAQDSRMWAMDYMFSEQQWLGQRVERWHPHIMLYVPFATTSAFGHHELESGLPLAFDHQGGPLASFVIEAREFVPVASSPVKRQ